MIVFVSCRDVIEIFPYLREASLENSTIPEFVLCNRTSTSGSTLTSSAKILRDPPKLIYTSSAILGLRIRFAKPLEDLALAAPNKSESTLQIVGKYRFLNKKLFENDGRLISASYCDYYFFANNNENTIDDVNSSLSPLWKHFHSPRYPAFYPAHVKCSYKFIGR